MVSRGQYLERPALVPVGQLVLEGLWHRGSKTPPVLVLPPPPEAGSMDHVVCAELAWAAARAGRAGPPSDATITPPGDGRTRHERWR